MTEVRMTLYTGDEISMFAQFVEIIRDKRAREFAQAAQTQQLGTSVQEREQAQRAQKISDLPRSTSAAPGDEVVVPPAAPSVDPVAAAIEKFKAYGQEKGIPAARAVLDGLGVKRAGDITAAQVPALLEAIK